MFQVFESRSGKKIQPSTFLRSTIDRLLSESQRDRIDIVLVSPRNPLNIGAVARAMANFGFTRLTVVTPYEPHWREARSAVGAPELLQNAKESRVSCRTPSPTAPS